MTSKERTLRAIEFNYPDRIPLCTGIDHDNEYNINADRLIRQNYEGDIIVISECNPDFQAPRGARDEWGCIWTSFGDTMGEVTDHPLKEWKDFADFEENSPDYRNPERYKNVTKKRNKFPDKYLLCGLGFMMMDIINYRGYENYMVDLCLERENLSRLIDLIYRKAYDKIDMYKSCGADGIIAWEDWGLQDRLMMSPLVWRSLFKEPMKKMISYIHSKQLKYVLHSCGLIKDIMDDLIEIGIDVLQIDQQMNMGLDYLSLYKGKICFFCPADIQLTSCSRDLRQTEEYCTSLIKALSSQKGGFMYKTYSQPKAVDISVETILTECRVFSYIGIQE